METITVKVDGKEYKLNVEEEDSGDLKVYFENEIYQVETKEDINQLIDEEISVTGSRGEDSLVVRAPLPGKVLAVSVKQGQAVKEGELLIKFVAMKMENEIASPANATVKEIKVKVDDAVNRDDVLIILE